MSFLVLHHLEEEERAGCFAFIVLRISCCCKCSVTLPHGAMGWYAVCDYVFFLIKLTYFLLSCLQVLEYFDKQRRLDVDNERTRHDFYCCKYIKIEYDKEIRHKNIEQVIIYMQPPPQNKH